MKHVKVWIISFVLFLGFKIIFNRYVGSFYLLYGPIKWDEIMEELPTSIIMSIITASLLTYAYSQDHKVHTDKKSDN